MIDSSQDEAAGVFEPLRRLTGLAEKPAAC
jgi:hypothetical protein